MKYFNTAGPVNCEDHYCLPPLERFDLEEILFLIRQKKYFVLHAPRQTGKTTSLLALMDYLFLPNEDCRMPEPDKDNDIDFLSGCRVFEVTGAVDFQKAARDCIQC